MNSKHLGDALDHWKGSIIQRLESRGLLQDIAVIPMLTDGSWNSKKVSAYSNLLNIGANKILQTGRIFGGNKYDRDKYFKDISHAGDLFLDPDTGVSISKNDSEHITISEISKLLPIQNSRVILIYQQRGQREQFPPQIRRIVQKVRYEIEKLSSATYECGNVAMLFFSRDKGRTEQIAGYLKTILSGDMVSCDKNGESKSRVIMW